MKKIAALVSIFAIAASGSAFAIDSHSGNYTVTTDALDAFDCELSSSGSSSRTVSAVCPRRTTSATRSSPRSPMISWATAR